MPASPLSGARLCYLPIDARPVCYDFVKQLALFAGLEVTLPSANLLGHLKRAANLPALQRWIAQHLPEQDALLIAWDTWLYGGLIAGRVATVPSALANERIRALLTLLPEQAALYGFASIQRIPNYNSSEEEPEYWGQYGQALHAYSLERHRLLEKQVASPEGWERLFTPDHALQERLALPATVLLDFLARRRERFLTNTYLMQALEHYSAHQEQSSSNCQIFCQDDNHAEGLNVLEAALLQDSLPKALSPVQLRVQSGADELAHLLLARWMVQQASKTQDPPLKIWVSTSADDVTPEQNPMAYTMLFDGVSLKQVLEQRFALCQVKPCQDPSEADMWLILHTSASAKGQGDHCVLKAAHINAQQHEAVLALLNRAQRSSKPVALADVSHANGCDSQLMELLLTKAPSLVANLYGFAGWNTPGNSIGCALAMGLLRLMAERNGQLNAHAFRQALLVRLADDWLYQSQVRTQIRSLAGYRFGAKDKANALDTAQLNALMANGLSWLKTVLDLEHQRITCDFPCQRTFELRLTLSNWSPRHAGSLR